MQRNNGEGFNGLLSPQNMLKIITFCSVLGLVFSLLAFGAATKAKKNAAAASEKIDSSMMSVTQTISGMEEELGSISDAVSSTAASISSSTASRYISILKQPESVSTTLGRTDAKVFEVQISGDNPTYTWQKFDEATGEWSAVPFDINGFCDSFGLRLFNGYSEDDKTLKVSQIWAKNLTELAFGRYRCVITDSIGNTVTSEMAYIYEREA